ncbi:MAG: SDR family oxidoreductase [Oscillospiraceae bacterium]
MKIDLTGKKALVTGGSGELGRVIVRKLAECGADVAVHYHQNRTKAEELVAELTAAGRRACAVAADVTDKESILAMRGALEAEFGLPDVLVCNAVVQYLWKTVIEQDDADFYSQFNSCVMHNVWMYKAFAPHMIAQNYGRIVVMNTECAAACDPNTAAYTAAKRGMDGLVRCFAKEAGPHGITVNQVAPGWTISERERTAGIGSYPDYEQQVPLRRRGTDEDVANMVCFLASDLAGFTTGAYVPVTGGRIMGI